MNRDISAYKNDPFLLEVLVGTTFIELEAKLDKLPDLL
jgi:hypothetical protein